MNSITNYLSETIIELKERVTWPTMEEIQKMSTIVILSLIVVTIIVFLMDWISKLGVIDMFYGNI